MHNGHEEVAIVLRGLARKSAEIEQSEAAPDVLLGPQANVPEGNVVRRLLAFADDDPHSDCQRARGRSHPGHEGMHAQILLST